MTFNLSESAVGLLLAIDQGIPIATSDGIAAICHCGTWYEVKSEDLDTLEHLGWVVIDDKVRLTARGRYGAKRYGERRQTT